MRLDVIAGRFTHCDPIAGGSTGTVWRAWDLKQRRFYADKVLQQRDSGDLMVRGTSPAQRAAQALAEACDRDTLRTAATRLGPGALADILAAAAEHAVVSGAAGGASATAPPGAAAGTGGPAT
jgi:hypothetical protein